MNKKINSFLTIVILLCIIFSLPAFAETVMYEYDGLHRLTRVERDKTLTIYEYDDLGNRTSMVVTLKYETPTALFSASPTSGVEPLPVSFMDQSTGDITSWSWSFGDGEISTDQNPTHTYNTAGTYTVSLTVTGPGGSDTKTILDYILVQEDSDGDGLSDTLENTICTDPFDADTDNDSISDGAEDVNKNGVVDPGETDPCNNDSDGDGMPDGWEVVNNLDPLDNDAFADKDGDGFCNWREYLAGTDPDDPGYIPDNIDIHVDDDNTSGIEDGSVSNPFNTIQEGVDFSGPGDTVSVSAGNYVENVLMNKDIFLVGEGAKVTIIDGSGAEDAAIRCVSTTSGQIKGFHIHNGTGAGIRCEDAVMSIERNMISSTSNGDGIKVGAGSSVNIENNVIYENNLDGIAFESLAVTIVNNTIVSNGGDGISCSSGDGVVIENNIIVSNGDYGIYCNPSSNPDICYNNLWNNSTDNYSGCSTGTGDISDDPRFKDSVACDFHITTGSPCIDAGTSDGTPEFDFDGNGRSDDPNTEPNTGGGTYTYYDIGAFEYLLVCEGDFDNDGDVDGSDLAVFAADFGRTDCDTGEECEGDFDTDDDVDGSDLAVFAADFGRTDCPN